MAFMISVLNLAHADHLVMTAWLKEHGVDPTAVFQVAVNAASMEATIYEYERNAQGRFLLNEARDGVETREPYSIPIRVVPTLSALLKKAASVVKEG